MGTLKNDRLALPTKTDSVAHPMTKYSLLTVVVIPFLVACSPSGVSRLLPTDDTRFAASARPIRPPAQVRCRQIHKKPAGKLLCKRQHWFRYRVENVGERAAFALCHIQAFAHGKPLTPNRFWSPEAGRNEIKAGDVVTRAEMTQLKTTRRVTRWALSCRAAMWTNGPPV
ncbi:MAG: hypothetical protein M3P01_05940 [Actinomycetota bacterium]|nr:hypothetical protein [Actinomycetota bacterium]